MEQYKSYLYGLHFIYFWVSFSLEVERDLRIELAQHQWIWEKNAAYI